MRKRLETRREAPQTRREAPKTRREALRTILLGAGSAALLARRAARGAAETKLDENDPAAKALGYVESASRVDLKKYPHYVQGSICENCLQLQGKPGYNYRACTLFPGKLVSVSGWCSGWTAEM